jgi:hypothetical protein
LDIQDVFALSFFFDKGASPQPVHQLMHTASLLTKSVGTTKFNHYKQTKSRVDTKINQKKTRPIEKKYVWDTKINHYNVVVLYSKEYVWYVLKVTFLVFL